jgi:lysophospholipase L1-like esterase
VGFTARLAHARATTRLLVASMALLVAASAACRRTDAPIEPAPAPESTTTSSLVPTAAAAPPPTVRYVGRFEPTADQGMRFAWSGSAVIARFSGTGVSVRLRDEGKHHLNSFQIVVDGAPKGVLTLKGDRELYPVASGLGDGVHEIALYKRTEAKVGEVVFLGFEPEGKILPAPPAPERRIELIGDSITTGYGNEGPSSTCGFNPNQQNAYLTYGAIAARELSAEHVNIAWSGKTLYAMREYFPRSLPERDASRWDFSRYQPHLVVLNVGTNNFANVDPGERRFTQLYTELYERVRAAYPKAFIACALGPMLTDVYPPGRKNLTKAKQYMRAVVAKLQERDPDVALLEFPEQKHADGLGCGFHPSLKTHKLMADRLVAFARERLGW